MTDTPITVTALGWWDADGDGLGASHQVGIWDVSGNLLMSATAAAGTAGPLESGFRFDAALTGATTLAPGTYVIGGKSEFADPNRLGFSPPT